MDRHRVPPDTRVSLAMWDPQATPSFVGGKRDGRRRLEKLVTEIAGLQRVMWAENKHKLLVVLQAMDTAGKDGTIRAVFSGVNPQGVHVANFKAPTSRELEHDYLWRVHARTPGNGEIAVFNRSHYEELLIVRVLGLVSETRWRRRYDHINAFERMLADEGTTILKFYLHISRDEQRRRLQARLDDPDKHWKFNEADLEHRALWDDYMAAFEDVLSLTSTPVAPWHVVPSNRKWYRNLVVAETVRDSLRSLEMHYPETETDLGGVVIN